MMTAVSKKSNGDHHRPLLLALWDPVGIAHELHGYRNDAAGWISKYGTERELEITALNALEGIKKALEAQAAQKARAAADANYFHWTRESSAIRVQNFAKLNPSDGIGRARQTDLCLRWEQDSAQKVPAMIATRRESGINLAETAWQTTMAGIDNEIRQWKTRKDEGGRSVSELQRDRTQRWEASAVAEAWPKYKKKIDEAALDLFRRNQMRFLSDATRLIDERTQDLIAWLDASHLTDALTEFHLENIADGVAFEDTIGALLFGVSSSEKGALKIAAWINEANATEQNLLWRAIATNQSDGISAVNAVLAAAISHKNTPFTEAALHVACDSIKYLSKIAELAKKALSLHNSLRKDGIARVPTGGIEKILMTVGNRFFPPFVKIGADFLSEKIIHGLLLAKAGASYCKIMDLMLAEAKYGSIGRTETLVTMSMGHVIAAETASHAHTSLRSAWKALATDADAPKANANPQLAGGFNEAKELRFAMIATLLQGVFAVKLMQDAKKNPTNSRLQSELLAAELSLAAGLVDLGATSLKVINTAKDTSIGFQVLKLLGGILSAGAACIAVASDFDNAKKETAANHYAIAKLYKLKAFSNLASGSCSLLVAVSYTAPVFERLATTLPSTALGRTGLVIPRLASPLIGRLVVGRALLMVAGLWLSVGITAIQLLIWKFSDDELQIWCGRCAFGVEIGRRQTSANVQMSTLEDALREVLQ